jgi:hypothetical protein
MYKLLLIGVFSWLECKKEKGEVNLKPILTSRYCRLSSKLFVPLCNLCSTELRKFLPVDKTVADLKGCEKLKLTDLEFRVR